MRSSLLSVAASLFVAVVVACSSEAPAPRTRTPAQNGNAVGNNNNVPLGATVTYNDSIAPLIAQYQCASCHASQNKGPVLGNYAAVKSSASSVLQSVSTGNMPPNAASSGTALKAPEIKLLNDWIAAGYPEKRAVSTTPTTTIPPGTTLPPANVISYEGWTKGFIQDNCLRCHGAFATSPDLSTYALLKANAQLSMTELKNGTMPKNSPAVPADQIQKFQAWLSSGALEKNTDAVANTTVVTYAGDISPWVSQHCLQCHNTGGTNPILATKDQVQVNAGTIINAVQTTMPKGNAPMAAADYAVIQKWVDQGEN